VVSWRVRRGVLIPILVLLAVLSVAGILYWVKKSKLSVGFGDESPALDLSEARDPEAISYELLANGTLEVEGRQVRYLAVEFPGIRWKGKQWGHHAWIFYSDGCESELGAVVTGGPGPDGFKRFAMEFGARAVAETCVPVLILLDVPNGQFGLEETELMAFSMSRALETGDLTWHLVYPMAFAYSRAMTLESLLVPSHPGRFVLSGGSKRGLTTWIVAAYDDRVAAIAPRSYNGANLTALLQSHYEVYGKPIGSLAVLDVYGLLDQVNRSTHVDELLEVYDPVSHFDELSIPVMVVFGTRDQLSPPGVEWTYAPYYPGPLWFEVVPNATHTGLHSTERAAAAWRAFLAYVAGEAELPEVSVHVSHPAGGSAEVSAEVTCRCGVFGVTAWTATSESLAGLVAADWRPIEMALEGGVWRASIPVTQAYTGVFVEVQFSSAGIEGYVSSPRFVIVEDGTPPRD